MRFFILNIKCSAREKEKFLKFDMITDKGVIYNFFIFLYTVKKCLQKWKSLASSI